MKHKIMTMAVALTLTACATPPAMNTSSIPATPTAYKAQTGGDQTALDGRWTVAPPADAEPRGDWWRAFHDETLDRLIRRALANNNELQTAGAHLAQARAMLGSADAARMPQVNVIAGSARGTPAGVTPSASSSLLDASSTTPTRVNSVGANLAYEVDLAGRLSQTSRAAGLDAQSRAALLQSTRLMVEAEVAQGYLALRFADQERDLLRDTLDSYRETLQLTQRRYDAGSASELDLVRLQSEVASTEAEALGVDRQRAGLENALAVLLGESPSSFSLPKNAKALAAAPAIPGGLPGAMLARRPDVAAAERALMAAQARVGVAQAAWFPSLELTSAAGYGSSALSDVFRWSLRAWSVEALLSIPIFDGGRRQAGVMSASASMDLAMADYRQHILQALREVEDALSDLQWLARQADAQTQSLHFAERATGLAQSRYRNGLVSQLEWLDAQRAELRQRRQVLQLQAGRYQTTVGLIRALGGGWS